MDSRIVHGELIKTMHRFRRINTGMMFGKLSRGEFFTLEILRCQGAEGTVQGIYVFELAEKLEVSPPAVSRMLRNMEEQGWIQRVVEQRDRRNTRVLMTPQGEKILKTAGVLLRGFSDNVVETMGEEELETLLRLWNRLIDTIESELEKRDINA